jgi:hypothetical protein
VGPNLDRFKCRLEADCANDNGDRSGGQAKEAMAPQRIGSSRDSERKPA